VASAQSLEAFRLSTQQRWLWRLQDDGGPAPHTQSVVDLEGPLDPTRLRGAVEAAVGRHEALRTLFVRLPSVKLPLQAVQDDLPLLWREVRAGSAAA
jgi:hypothetical protein